jgi:DNA-binding transcriptional regulator GbsR (MarR family)
MANPTAGIASLDAPLLAVCDAIGGLMEFWGFKRAMGRMWTILYLSPDPLTAKELGLRLGMSAGAVSMTLAELAKWGVIKKTWRPGDRRDYHEPETSIWKMVSRVFRERELLQIRAAIEAFETTLAAVSRSTRVAASDDKKPLRFVTDRIQALLSLARVGESLLAAVLEGKRIDTTPIRAFIGR